MTKEWFEEVKSSVIVPYTDETAWAGTIIMDDEFIFSVTIKEFLNRLQYESEFYNDPTKETMIKLAKGHLNEMVDMLQVDGTAYIEQILPLFLEDVIKED